MSAKSRNSPPAACKFCGETRHTPANTLEDRRTLCKQSFTKMCLELGLNQGMT